MDEKKPLISAPTPSDPPLDYEASALGHGQPGPRPPQQQQTLPLRRPPPPPQIELPILQYLRTHRTILASASPRRRDLLAQLGLTNLEIIPSTKPENLSKKELGAYAYVSATAQQKALDVYASEIARVAADEEEEEEEEENEGEGEQENGGSRKRKSRKDPDLVISADTVIVTRDGTVLEKPPSEAAHRRMLRHLRDTRAHRVLTAVCAVAPRADAAHPGYALATHIEETRVYFARESDGLPDDVIDAYVRTREGADKAGGYAIQGLAGMLLVERVEGSVDNVVGLPVRKVLQVCEKVLFRQDEESDEEEDEDGFGNRDGE